MTPTKLPTSKRMMAVDDDLNALDRDQLIAEVRKLRRGIRAHRDSSGHELCWHHPTLWGLLPDPTPPDIAVAALAEVHARLCGVSAIIGGRAAQCGGS